MVLATVVVTFGVACVVALAVVCPFSMTIGFDASTPANAWMPPIVSPLVTKMKRSDARTTPHHP